jgi:serine protease AprX
MRVVSRRSLLVSSLSWLALLVLLASLMLWLPVSPRASAAAWQAKLDPLLAAQIALAPAEEQEFLIVLEAQADLSGAAHLTTQREKGAYVYQRLSEMAANSQKPLIAALEAWGVEVRPFWVVNAIWARGNWRVIQMTAERPDVARLFANPSVRLDAPLDINPLQEATASTADMDIEWNLLQVNADDVWAAGYSGQGVVVGGQDTGYDWEHPALKGKYRGWDGSRVDHNYNWHDAIHQDSARTLAGNPCGFDSLQPCDDNGHGTHTMGIILGDDGAGNRIGMAPAAQWIGCRNMEEGWGTPASYIECYQWFVAPTDLNNANPDPSKAPQVINNSWGCLVEEGCTEPDILLAVVQNVHAAGILTVHSAGNSGPSCETIAEPAAIYAESLTVGSTDSRDQIAPSSSRGPVTIDGSGRLKPDVVAPGMNIRSSLPGGGYGNRSGTSMAAPHVSGLAALLISYWTELAGQVDVLEELITHSALPLTSLESCGGTAGQVPNNVYGWGRMDAWAAYVYAQFLRSQYHAFFPVITKSK